MVDLSTMTQDQWNAMSTRERDVVRDNSGLSSQLTGLEGWRVEVTDEAGDTPRRFIVGKSTGWRPCHLEIVRVNSSDGGPARNSYFAVRTIAKVR